MTFAWGHERRFNAYASYCIRQYGSRLQKVSVNAGFSCPNRDGRLGSGGCTFCSNEGFNPSYCEPGKSLSQQIEEGLEFHKTRYRRAVKYLAYFQAFTNTYAPLGRLKSLYEEALRHPEVVGISIGTRPDCVPDDVLDYLQELSRNYIVNLEFGIESCSDNTLLRVNRGHSFARAEDAIHRAAERELTIGAHFIFGLPGESREEMLAQSAVINTLPLHHLKFHQLQIMKDTQMEREYVENSDDFNLFSLEEYTDFIIDFLERLRPDFLIERLCGEVPPRFLAVPGWGMIRNDQVIRRIESRMEERDTWQSAKFNQ